jgi:hypothetical protein
MFLYLESCLDYKHVATIGKSLYFFRCYFLNSLLWALLCLQNSIILFLVLNEVNAWVYCV